MTVPAPRNVGKTICADASNTSLLHASNAASPSCLHAVTRRHTATDAGKRGISVYAAVSRYEKEGSDAITSSRRGEGAKIEGAHGRGVARNFA
jgi:hypothetical protein